MARGHEEREPVERQFRRIIGYRDLAKLAVAIGRDLARTTAPFPTEEIATLVTA